MRLTVNNDLSYVFCNSVRQTILLSRYVIRPIAYSVNHASTVLTAGDVVLEDMVEFSVRLNKAAYVNADENKAGERNTEVYKVEADFSGTLTLADLLRGSEIKCTKEFENLELLHSSDPKGAKVHVEVYFAKNAGNKTANDNEFLLMHFLSTNGSGTLSATTERANGAFDGASNNKISDRNSSIVTIASHHNDVRRCAFEVTTVNTEQNVAVVEFNVETVSGVSCNSVVHEALGVLQGLFSNASTV